MQDLYDWLLLEDGYCPEGVIPLIQYPSVSAKLIPPEHLGPRVVLSIGENVEVTSGLVTRIEHLWNNLSKSKEELVILTSDLHEPIKDWNVTWTRRNWGRVTKTEEAWKKELPLNVIPFCREHVESRIRKHPLFSTIPDITVSFTRRSKSGNNIYTIKTRTWEKESYKSPLHHLAREASPKAATLDILLEGLKKIPVGQSDLMIHHHRDLPVQLIVGKKGALSGPGHSTTRSRSQVRSAILAGPIRDLQRELKRFEKISFIPFYGSSELPHGARALIWEP